MDELAKLESLCCYNTGDMTWQAIILAQVLVSAIMTIFTRKLSLLDRKLFFVIGCASYGMVAVIGLLVSWVFGPPHISFPGLHAWPFLLIEGVCIPVSWLLQYKIIQIFGASNAMLITVMNYMGTAALGFIFLHESFSADFFVGLVCILASIWLAFRVQPDSVHKAHGVSLSVLFSIACMVATYSVGMLAEKQAISIIGVWDYARYGWFLQFMMAATLLIAYGRKEFRHVTREKIRRGLLLGVLTSLAGVLYIYALSIGSLSGTIIAASGKIALIMFLAALFLKERNAIGMRAAALVLAVTGLAFLTLK